MTFGWALAANSEQAVLLGHWKRKPLLVRVDRRAGSLTQQTMDLPYRTWEGSAAVLDREDFWIASSAQYVEPHGLMRIRGTEVIGFPLPPPRAPATRTVVLGMWLDPTEPGSLLMEVHHDQFECRGGHSCSSRGFYDDLMRFRPETDAFELVWQRSLNDPGMPHVRAIGVGEGLVYFTVPRTSEPREILYGAYDLHTDTFTVSGDACPRWAGVMFGGGLHESVETQDEETRSWRVWRPR